MSKKKYKKKYGIQRNRYDKISNSFLYSDIIRTSTNRQKLKFIYTQLVQEYNNISQYKNCIYRDDFKIVVL